MLGRIGIADLRRLRHGVHDNHATCRQRLARYTGTRQLSSSVSSSTSTASASAGASVISSACESAPCSACDSRSAATRRGSASAVGDHQHFGWTSRHVDCRTARLHADLALGFCNPGVARAEQFVAARHACSAQCHGGDGLRAAQFEDTRDSELLSNIHHRRIRPAVHRGGVHSTRSGQPASRAGTPSINAVENSGALPAGTYKPTHEMGRCTCSHKTPGAVSIRAGAGAQIR